MNLEGLLNSSGRFPTLNEAKSRSKVVFIVKGVGKVEDMVSPWNGANSRPGE